MGWSGVQGAAVKARTWGNVVRGRRGLGGTSRGARAWGRGSGQRPRVHGSGRVNPYSDRTGQAPKSGSNRP